MKVVNQIARLFRVLSRARRNRLDLVRLLGRRPFLLLGTCWYELGTGLSARVDPHLKSLASLKAAAMVHCEYCIDIGSAIARADGITERQLRELHRYQDSDAFDDDQRLVLDLAVAMTSVPVTISPDLRERVDRRFSPAERAELASLIAWENHRARLNQALGIRPSGFSDGEVCALPQPADDVAAIAALASEMA